LGPVNILDESPLAKGSYLSTAGKGKWIDFRNAKIAMIAKNAKIERQRPAIGNQPRQSLSQTFSTHDAELQSFPKMPKLKANESRSSALSAHSAVSF
jgi:hypothetical protein